MKLLTDKIEKRFSEIGSQDESEDPVIVAKFFNPAGGGTWLASEILEYEMMKENEDETQNWATALSLQEKEDLLKAGYKVVDIIMFGCVYLFADIGWEWGSFSLKELENCEEVS